VRGALSLTALGLLVLVAISACAPSAAAPSAATPAPTTNPTVAQANPTGAPPNPTAAPAAKPTTAAGTSGDVASFYRGKTLRLVVGFSPGGGYDTYTRLIGRHLGDHVSGNPTVVVENMPGAGSLVAANWLANVAPKDGTVGAVFSGQLFMQRLFGAPAVQFDSEQFEFLGVPVADNFICVASDKSGFKQLSEAQKPSGRQIVMGAGSPGDPTTDVMNVLTAALDLNVRLVGGYPGTTDIRNAMERGEVDGMCGWSWESAKLTNLEDLQSGRIVVLTQVSEEQLPDLPVSGVPAASDLATTPESRDLIHYGLYLPSRIVRPYLLPPGTPRDRVAALQAAWSDTFADPALRADADKAKLALAPVGGDRVRAILHEIESMPAPIKDRLRSILVAS
jgi:tripartite-type tricarboxylate transporter receptor subunit TctC